MELYLHNPASEAHLEDLRDRLLSQLCSAAHDDSGNHALVERLVSAVRSMDKGVISTKDVLEMLTRHGVPSFSRWLVDMVDEGVYLDYRLDRAA